MLNLLLANAVTWVDILKTKMAVLHNNQYVLKSHLVWESQL